VELMEFILSSIFFLVKKYICLSAKTGKGRLN
jgi:hypothetical protein